MSTLKLGRRRRIEFAFVIAGLMMSTVTTKRTDASLIRPEAVQKPVYYASSGTLGTPDGVAEESLRFVGVSTSSTTPAPAGVFYMPGVFSLGGFQTRGLPKDVSRTVDALPFTILLDFFSDPFVSRITSQIRIEGVLDGELSNEPGKGLLASVTSVAQVGTPIGTPPFRVEDLQILAPQFILPAGSLPTMTTPLYGYVDAQVPEPTALMTLGLGGAALALGAWRRRRRSAGTNGSGNLIEA